MVQKFTIINIFIKALRKLYDLSPSVIAFNTKGIDVQVIKKALPYVDVTVYKAIEETKKLLPILVYYHGGGWMLGSSKSYERICKLLAHRTRCIVVSCDYRLAPEYKFPAAYNDAIACYDWVYKNAKKFGGNAEFISIAGDSAGGNLAMNVVFYRLKNNLPLPYAQALIYPVVKASKKDLTDISTHKNPLIRFIGLGVFNFFLKNYFYPNKYFKDEISISKAIPNTPSNFPKTLIITSALDPLTPLIVRKVLQFHKKGIHVLHKHYAFTAHGFMNFTRFSKSANLALAEICKLIRIHN